jgi:hypothetical protein
MEVVSTPMPGYEAVLDFSLAGGVKFRGMAGSGRWGKVIE